MVGASGRMGQSILQQQRSFGAHCVATPSRTEIADLKIEDDCRLLIDFSLPEANAQVLHLCRKHSLSLVSGVTGLSAAQMHAIESLGQEVAVFWSPNMSLGIALMRQMLQLFSGLEDWDFHIHEGHHRDKKDAPSGTAIYLQQAIEQLTRRSVAVTAVRGGGVFGVHEFSAMSSEEELHIIHRAYHRAVFAKGALQAARWLQHQPPGVYNMDDLLA